MHRDRVDEGVAALARFAGAVAWRGLPPAVRERARLVLLDTLGVMIWGAQDPFLGELRGVFAGAYSPGKASVIGAARRFDPGPASMLNAASCTVTQLSEGHRRSRGDPGLHIVPAALAVAEVEQSAGEDLLAAVVAGYEIAVRVGLALAPLPPDQHVHGHWASIGAAVAATKLLGGGPRELQHAIEGTAALLVYAPTSSVIEGTTVHHLYAGCGLQAAIGVAYAIRAGMTSSEGTLETYVSRRSMRPFDPATLAGGLDRDHSRFEILDNYFKLYPVCAQVITVIEAVDEVRRRLASPDEIRAVTIRASPAAVALCGGREARTTLASKFSIPCIAAARFIYPGQNARELHAIDVAAQPLRSMMGKIDLVADAALSPPYPEARPTIVEVLLGSGQTLVASKQIPQGDFSGNPIPSSAVVRKFRELAEPLLGSEGTRQLCALADAEAALPDARALAALARI
jgi:2-methylcitrate dehydratase PrpD